jgi:hypothetical protein
MHACTIYSKDAHNRIKIFCFFSNKERAKEFCTLEELRVYTYTSDNSRIRLDGYIEGTTTGPTPWWSRGVWQVHNVRNGDQNQARSQASFTYGY